MPWCLTCEKNWTPTSVGADGSCPECGEALEPTPGVDHTPENPGGMPAAVAGPPWHFWLGVTAAGLYLLWRAVQGVVWLF